LKYNIYFGIFFLPYPKNLICKCLSHCIYPPEIKYDCFKFFQTG